MHELSIARSLVRICDEAAREAGATRVTRVHVQLGPLAGVVREALEFAYDFATEDSLLAGSALVIEEVPVVVRCESCARDVEPESPHCLRCPECDAPTPTIKSGRELLVRAIDYDDSDDPAPPESIPRVRATPSDTSPAAVAQSDPTL